MNRIRRDKQSGVSIVELMVAMLVGSIVILGTVQIFNANRQTFRMQDAMAVTQETGTFALDFIVRDVLRAGYPGYPLASQSFDWTNTTNNDANGNDTLAVIYDSGVANNVLCTGDTVAPGTQVSNHYYVNNNQQLMCQGGIYIPPAPPSVTPTFTPVGTAQVLVDNVESFQVLFGVDLAFSRDPTKVPTATAGCPDDPASPTQYVNAASIAAALNLGNNPPNAACSSPMPELQVIRTVRIGLLVKTPGTVDVTIPSTQTYTVLDQVIGAPKIQPDDGHMRRLFLKTTSLRNNVETF